jgi:hypothetical protein
VWYESIQRESRNKHEGIQTARPAPANRSTDVTNSGLQQNEVELKWAEYTFAVRLVHCCRGSNALHRVRASAAWSELV